VVEGREYTARASIMCTGSTLRSWRMEIWWYKDSGGTHVSTSSGTLTECPAGTWTDITVTATAPSATPDTDRALVAIYRQQDTDTNSVFMDCVALCPGDYDRWHLPSQSPGLIEFSSAPSSGARITANVTGARVARVVIDPNRLSWQMRNSDKAYPSGLIATEAPEF